MTKLAISLLLYLACFYAVGYGAGYITGGITWHTLYMLERIITVALIAFIPVFIFAALLKSSKRQGIIKSLSVAATNIIPSAIALLIGFTDAVTREFLTYFLG
ncbi:MULTISPECIES: hypothetical protein [Enterobacter cloacae complex]|uniref:hypothetical protein n=1 Tax=Enterobacter cloacae complex TaxID=354276 RepID=UPI001C708BD6|nr:MULTISPECIES: hypothetical protein [Enterobacter cloacae complex]HAV9264611.1 hypothetical protein [Escherichia coli]MBW9441635.1 hypothetical protein [Enterobacter roggenkampii]MCC2892942.1 hypothetical protein [Enterobacter hormaechei]MCE1306193.1 hypothetical protein [Enterobacter hormaechei]MCQ4215960.1 hypothetical protein [Enterobacter hormaechei]